MKKFLIFLIAIVSIGAGCTSTAVDNNLRPAPAFDLVDYNGEQHSLADYAGKHLVINSWAAWCPFCKKELVDFAAVQQELGDEVQFIAINRSESLETAKGFTDEHGISDDMIFLLDPEDSFYQSIAGFAMPETIFVNPEGQIVFHKRGVMTKKELMQAITDVFELN